MKINTQATKMRTGMTIGAQNVALEGDATKHPLYSREAHCMIYEEMLPESRGPFTRNMSSECSVSYLGHPGLAGWEGLVQIVSHLPCPSEMEVSVGSGY
jgi:hypothetical protein